MPINTSLNKTKRYSRFTYGDDGQHGKRNILSVSFVACDLMRASAAGTNQIMTATALSNTAANSYVIAPNPDVPRNAVVVIGGTAASVPAGNVVVTGTNSEGAVITENLALTAGATGTLTGNKAFRTIVKVTAPQATGTGATLSVGWGAKLGIGMRNIAGMPVKVLVRSAAGVETMEDPSTSVLSPTVLENNTVTTTTAQDGARAFRVYVLNYKWAVNPVNAQPDYGV